MKDTPVETLMVPLAEYATVAQDATLYEAILALENAQAEFDETRYRHRAILVYDESEKIVGKLSQMDIIKATEPDYGDMVSGMNLSRFGISNGYIADTLRQYDFWNRPLDQLCATAGRQKVADIMYSPTEEEYIQDDASLQEAIHRFIIGHHHSLLVTANKEIVGVLRLVDVFASVCQTMKEAFED